MPFLSNSRHERGVRRKTFEIVLAIAIVLSLVCIFLLIRLFGGSTSDTTLQDTLVEWAIQEDAMARESASQLSRTGGTTTVHLLGKTAQHLYALDMINELWTSWFGNAHPLVPPTAIDAAMKAVDDSEALVLGAQTIDVPLAELHLQLNEIANAVDNSTN